MVKTGKQKTALLWENMEEQNHKQERKQPNLNNESQQQAAMNVNIKEQSVHSRHTSLLRIKYASAAFPLAPQYLH